MRDQTSGGGTDGVAKAAEASQGEEGLTGVREFMVDVAFVPFIEA